MFVLFTFALFVLFGPMACMDKSYEPKDIVIGSVGVIMEDMGTITESRSTWKHTFVIDIPTPMDVKLFMCTDTQKVTGTCVKDGSSDLIQNIKAMDQHMLYEMELLRTNLINSFQTFTGRSRKLRGAPLSFIGSLHSSVFGMATMEDLQGVVNAANELIRRNGKIAKDMVQLSGSLASFIGISTSRYDTLKSLLNDTRGTMKEFNNANRVLYQYLNIFDKSMQLLFVLRNVSFDFVNHVHSVNYAVEELKRGQLPSLLLPDHAIKSAVDHIAARGSKNHQLVYFPHDSIAYYRRRASFIVRFQKDASKLWVTLDIPYSVSPLKRLYKIRSFPVPLEKNSKHSTKIQDLPHFLVVSPGHPKRYAELSDDDYFDNCDHLKSHGFFHTDCHQNLQHVSIESSTCLASLLSDSGYRIRSNCHFQILKDSAKPTIFPISSGRILVIGMDTVDIVMRCNRVAKDITGCSFCIIDIPCTCVITSLAHTFSSRSFQRCLDPQQITSTKRHLFNLVSIRDYVGHLVEKTSKASSTYAEELNAKLPEINLSPAESKFQTADYASQLTMRQLKGKVQENDKVFEDVYEHMLEGELEVEKTGKSPLSIVAIVCAIATGIITILNYLWYLLFKRLVIRQYLGQYE